MEKVGWVCPVCGKGNAPWMPTCGHCVANKNNNGEHASSPQSANKKEK